MLEGKALDQFMDRFFGDSCAQSLPGEEESGQELEEYELKEDGIIIQPIHKGKIEKRTWIGLIMFLAFVPLVLFILVHKFHGKHDVVISLLILAYATIPFFMVFEGRHPQAREIMVIAVMAALGVAGRSAFFMIGSFKPIAAIVIITGVSLGGEAGFLCACLIMMISNMFFGQGPWTPWQMFSYGMIGYLAGILFRKGFSKQEGGSVYLRILKCVSDLRRDHESGIYSDGIRIHHKEEPDRVLYLRCTGRSGAGNFYGNLPVDPKQASAGETGESKKKIRAAAAARK